jgi:signal transduction histidine kinase
MFRDEVAARGVHLQLEEDKSMRALQIDLVRGDSSRFVQVIVNLLSNAIKFTGSAPHPIIRVRIGATEVPEGTDAGWTTVMDHQDLLPMCRSPNSRSGLSQLRLYIAVADSGLGMTEQEQSCLFQRFAQANPRTYGEFGGSGLGLVSDISRLLDHTVLTYPQYVSRMLVELQGGKIHLQSQQGVGSIFQFYIVVERSTAGLMPLMTPPNELPSITTKDSLLEPPPAEHLRVLVVEVRTKLCLH